MSKNTDTQNLLVNVFRPVYSYETPAGGSTPVFTSKIILTNIDTVYANTIAATNYQVGDSNNNLYLGCNAGNTADNTNACANVVGIGASAASNVSNVSNSTYLGTAAGAGATNASNVIAIGTSANGNGVNNVYIGNATGNIGSNNIFLGHSNAPAGTINNTLRIGKTVLGDLSNNKIGIGVAPSYELDVSGTTRISTGLGVAMTPCNVHALDVSGYTYIRGGVGINADPLDHTLTVNGDLYVSDGNARYYFNQDASQNSVFTVESLDPTKKAVFVIHGDISADNLVLDSITYTNLTITGTMKSADVSATTVRVQDIIANTFTAGTFGATDLSAGILTVTSVNAISDISAATVNATNLNITSFTTTDISASLIKVTDISGSTSRFDTLIGSDVSGTTARFDTMIGTDVSGSTARFDTVVGTDVSGSIGTFDTLVGTDVSGSSARFTTLFVTDICASSFVYVPTITVTGDISAAGTVYGGTLVGTDISGTTARFGTLFTNGTTSNNVGGVTLSNSNAIVGGFLRNALTPTTLDISGGNLSNSATHTSSNFIGTASASNSIGGVTLSNSNAIVGGFLRNALTPSTLDISGGNISNSATTRSSNFIGTTSSASNSIGGVTLSNTNITYAGAISNSTASSSNRIGGVTLSNGNGTFTNGLPSQPSVTFSSDASSGLFLQNIGGVDVTAAGVRVATFTTSSLTLSNSIPLSTAATASNSVGGVTLSNSNVSTSNGLFSGYLRNALTPTTWDISGGNISNSATTRSSNFIGTTTASNSIGGILLSNSNVGIGTSSPLGPLDVLAGGIVVNRLGNITNSTDVSAIVEGSSNVGVYWQKGSNNNNCGISFKTLSNNTFAERMRVDANTGRIGIATTAPAVPLDVSGRVRILQDGSTSLTSYGLNNNADTLILQHSGAYTTAGDLNKSASLLFANATLNNPQARIASEMTSVTPSAFGANLIFQTNAQGVQLAERMRIHSNGFVGIGTAAPGQALDVSGGLRGTTALTISNASGGLISASIASSTYGGLTHNGYYSLFKQGTSSGAGNQLISFPTDSPNLTNYFMSNRVGIGTTSASYALDISAGTSAPSLNMSSWLRVPADNMLHLRTASSPVGMYAITFANTDQAINSNLIVYTRDATNGDTFSVRKNGYYSFFTRLWLASPGSTWGSWLAYDTSGNTATEYTGTSVTSNMVAMGLHYYYGTLAFTGYLSSNSTKTYRIKTTTGLTAASNSNSTCTVIFHGENASTLAFPG